MKPLTHHSKKEKRSPFLISLLIVTIITLCISFWLLCSGLYTDISKQESNVSLYSTFIEKNENSISIPGYEGITLKADSLQQELTLYNPIQNTCYFVISLYLEDGTLLWESDYIEPGHNSVPIVLTQRLEKGIYPNAVLKYSCFKMNQEKTPLNGAKTKLTLRVK